MSVPVLTAISVVLYAMFAFFLSRMGGRINANLGSAIFTGLGMVIPLAYYLWERVAKSTELTATTSAGLLYSILAGIAIAIWNVIIIVIFAKGGSTGYVFPITYGLGAIAIPTIISWLVLKESIGAWQGFGLALVVIGIAIIAFSQPA